MQEDYMQVEVLSVDDDDDTVGTKTQKDWAADEKDTTVGDVSRGEKDLFDTVLSASLVEVTPDGGCEKA